MKTDYEKWRRNVFNFLENVFIYLQRDKIAEYLLKDNNERPIFTLSPNLNGNNNLPQKFTESIRISKPDINKLIKKEISSFNSLN